MGEHKVQAASRPSSVKKFVHALLRDLKALEIMLEKGMIEDDVQRIGAEQELCLIDRYWRPAPIITDILPAIDDPHFTTELARFNLEINLDPLIFSGDCFSKLEQALNGHLSKLSSVAQKFDADYVLTGILPTIRGMDLELDNITPNPRYAALFEALEKMRGGPFEYHIRGNDELIYKQVHPTMEFVNTSFQVHYQTRPDVFIDTYNFSKLMTAPVLAAAVNSPLLLGKRLWKETRISIFQQAIDTRNISSHLREKKPRVSFSQSWIKDSVTEIFQDDISRFRVLLCADTMEDSLKVLADGGVPKLQALQIFNGTVYRWGRACYGISDGKPHLRIENRVIPAGPTVADQLANAAFWLGLMNAMPEKYKNLPEKMNFDDVMYNFITAARSGLSSQFRWLNNESISARSLIMDELLPISHEGLKKAKVDDNDRKRFLNIIEERVCSKKTGAKWILNSYAALRKEGSQDEALVALTAGMVHRQKTGAPVHTWSIPSLADAGSWMNKYWHVEQIMSSDLFTVEKDDLVDLVIHIMKWKNIHHVPVEDSKGRIIGLITSGMLIHHFASNFDAPPQLTSVKDIMIKSPICITPEAHTMEAIQIMKEKKIGCLPVVKDDKLVGILTEHDFLKITHWFFQEFTGLLQQNGKPEE